MHMCAFSAVMPRLASTASVPPVECCVGAWVVAYVVVTVSAVTEGGDENDRDDDFGCFGFGFGLMGKALMCVNISVTPPSRLPVQCATFVCVRAWVWVCVCARVGVCM